MLICLISSIYIPSDILYMGNRDSLVEQKLAWKEGLVKSI